MGVGCGEMGEISLSSSQFCYKPKTGLKKLSLKKFKIKIFFFKKMRVNSTQNSDKTEILMQNYSFMITFSNALVEFLLKQQTKSCWLLPNTDNVIRGCYDEKKGRGYFPEGPSFF